MAINNQTLSNTTSIAYISVGENLINTMYFCNLSPNTLNVNVYLVPSGTIANVGWQNLVYYNLPITSNDTFLVSTERMLLADGDALWVDASGDANVILTISSIGI